MGFLKKHNAPSELPDLAADSLGESAPVEIPPQATAAVPVADPVLPAAPQPVVQPVVTSTVVAHIPEEKPVAGEDYLEVSHEGGLHENIKKNVDESLAGNDADVKLPKVNFFDQVLEDINEEVKDVGKLGDWYEKKFMKEDVVGNMRGYWEGNKADIIIESFGAEYKRQINDKVKVLRELEEDWREIYFRLIKKEEEMKKEERELKETLSEFVNLCKRRKHNGKEKK